MPSIVPADPDQMVHFLILDLVPEFLKIMIQSYVFIKANPLFILRILDVQLAYKFS